MTKWGSTGPSKRSDDGGEGKETISMMTGPW